LISYPLFGPLLTTWAKYDSWLSHCVQAPEQESSLLWGNFGGEMDGPSLLWRGSCGMACKGCVVPLCSEYAPTNVYVPRPNLLCGHDLVLVQGPYQHGTCFAVGNIQMSPLRHLWWLPIRQSIDWYRKLWLETFGCTTIDWYRKTTFKVYHFTMVAPPWLMNHTNSPRSSLENGHWWRLHYFEWDLLPNLREVLSTFEVSSNRAMGFPPSKLWAMLSPCFKD